MNGGSSAHRGPHADLRELARACGVETAYTDVFGERRTASPEALLAVLRTLGVEVRGPEEAAAALRRRRRVGRERLLEATVVTWEGDPGAVDLCLPEPPEEARAAAVVELEEGGERVLPIGPKTLHYRGPAGEGQEGRHAYRLALPVDLPTGYHRLRVEAHGRVEEAWLLRAPRRAWRADAGPSWGAFLPLYALRSRRDWGIGDTTDLAALAEWIGRRGGRLVGTLPLLSTFLSHPFEPSPYAPASRLFWNEAYLDPTRAPGWRSDLAAEGAGRRGDLAADIEALRRRELVDHRRVAAVKRRVLERLAERFFAAGGESDARYRWFLEERPEAVPYARFRATAERRREPWTDWPARQRDGHLRPGDGEPAAERYHLFAQWLAHEQMADLDRTADAAGCGLYLDLPLGCHPDGFDVWRERGSFARGASVGAPPDDFFAAGQDWGFPPLHPEAARENGYRYVRASLRHSMRHADVLRLDHVMGLHRLFWIPRELPAGEGVYVRYPAEELYAVLCLESHRARTELVGEDLGTVPEGVEEALARHGIGGMSVLQYQLGPDLPEGALPSGRAGDLASLNTHDMYPFAAWWRGLDVEEREALGLLSEEGAARERLRRLQTRRAVLRSLVDRGRLDPSARTTEVVLEAALRHIASGPARHVLVNLEDLWLEARTQNLPGTSEGPPNWRRKARLSLEEMEASERVRSLLEAVASERPGRRGTEEPSRGEGSSPAPAASGGPWGLRAAREPEHEKRSHHGGGA